MSRTSFLLAAAVSTAVLASMSCLTDKNRCLHGSVYDSHFDVCFPVDGGNADTGASGTTQDAAPDQDSGAAAPSVGSPCNGPTDCTGDAGYCLKDPANEANPGICTVAPCTATECPTDFSCCNCSAGALPALQAWPVGTCCPNVVKDQLVQAGCTCQ